ncbi:MAG: type 1 glutamine amidotransferase [Leucobacter sp.]
MTDPRRPRVLCVVNSRSSGPRRLTQWFEEFGVELVEVFGGDGLPEDLTGFDALVLLGGGLMPNHFDTAPWLHAERKLTMEAILKDIPTLGICLGAQIIADVAGGEVRENYGPKERGSVSIWPTEAGISDPVLKSVGASAPMIENHEDMITKLPQSAVLLASSDAVANQAFVIGKHVRGVQFHPEASAENVANWDEAALQGDGYDIEAVVVEARANDARSTQASHALIAGFAAEIIEQAGVLK